ncbi:hypothetical protein R5R35_012736 [Gryllus longicercus]|uniref:Circadian clock-controlled protein n=1 Tax=Gryllus longicercus TaxID=2509291 RepID=A0AAN9ZAK5_9ORTH
MDLRSAALLPAWLLLLAAAAAAAPAAGPAELPSYVELCDRNHPERDACYAESLQRLLPILANGSQELGLAALDPHLLPEMLLQYKQGQVAGKMLIRNTRSIGLTSAQVLAVRSNLNDSNKFHMEVDLYFPRIFMEGDYKAQGKIVVFPIEGKGVYNISLTGVSTTWNLTGTHIKKRNQGYVRLDHFYMFPEVEDMKVYASNLFTGNEDFNRAALQFANDFWPVIYEELLPFANEAWDKVMRASANKVFLKFPFDTLFPAA